MNEERAARAIGVMSTSRFLLVPAVLVHADENHLWSYPRSEID